MKQVKYNDIVTNDLLSGNLDNNSYKGFLQDYRVLHCLLRKYKPKTIFEIGTNVGGGINVIGTALPNSKIISLDLDYVAMSKNPKEYPLTDSGVDRVGSEATFSYTQLRGDSMTFDYSKYYPIDAWFIDGAHDYQHPRHESKEAIKSNARLIIWHDADIREVNNAIIDSFAWNKEYDLFMVEGTRMAYAIHK